LALWAADCAGRALLFFEEERPEDDRPRRAVEAGLAWARGEIKVGEARAAAIAAHAAARATGHAAGYAARAVAYAKSPAAPDTAVATERDRQHRRLPERLRSVMFSAR